MGVAFQREAAEVKSRVVCMAGYFRTMIRFEARVMAV